jgi:hypothetical protein
MQKFIIIIILVCFILFITLKYKSCNVKIDTFATSKCWVNNHDFPEAYKIFSERHIIKDELIKVLNSDKWGIWSSDYSTTPIFTKMTDEEIVSRIEKGQGKISSTDEPSWRLFSLILNKNELPNSKLCPETIKLLKNCSNKILNAGFSVLEPGCYIGEHQDFNDKFYRLHIPLLIPKTNEQIQNSFVTKEEADKLCVLQVENDYKVWKENEYFIFDDTCLHNAWNNTKDIRIVLLVDLLKE